MIRELFLGFLQLLRWLYFGNTYNDPQGYVKDTKVMTRYYHVNQNHQAIVARHKVTGPASNCDAGGEKWLSINQIDIKSFDLQTFKTSYDFIVIGAGSAGAVIANRLTEVTDWNVLLLEAGDDESIAGQIPILAAALQLTKYDWQYETTVQSSGACAGITNKKYFIQSIYYITQWFDD